MMAPMMPRISDNARQARPLLLVGAGKMGGALLRGWLENESWPGPVVVVDPAPPPLPKGVTHHAEAAALAAGPPPAIAVLAVKPQIIEAALTALRPVLADDTMLVSVAAGTPIAMLERIAGARPVVRVMPNVPASVGRGMSVAAANDRMTAPKRATATRLMESVGRVEWVDDESLIDAVTAVSGSGPAYVFFLAECLAEAGVEAGLDRALAEELARVTVAGAGEMLWRGEMSAGALREMVTSPGGTTAAALDVLRREDALQMLMRRAVMAAKARAEELGRGST
jgi:pyrroline-5-carboxylate reductase